MRQRTLLALVILLPLSACDRLSKKLGETVAQKMYDNASVETDLLFVCPDGLESLYDQIPGKQQAFKEKKSPSPNVISPGEDARLVKTVEAYRKHLEELEAAGTQGFGKDEKKIQETQAEARIEYFQELSKEFPKLVGACADSYRTLAKECQKKYAGQGATAHDCRKFYGKRSLWEMIKLTKMYGEFTEQELRLLKPQFEETFETYLDDSAKQAAPNHAPRK